MINAVQTNASPAGIWAIVVIAVASLVFWLAMVAIASRKPGASRRRPPRGPGAGGSVLGGTHLAPGGRSVAPNRDAPATFAGAEPGAAPDAAVPPRQRTAEPAAPPGEPSSPTEPAAPPGRARVPGQRTASAPDTPTRPPDPPVRQGRAG